MCRNHMGGFSYSFGNVLGKFRFDICELHPIKHPLRMNLDRPSEAILTKKIADKLPRFKCEMTTMTNNRFCKEFAVSPALRATHPGKALGRSHVIIPMLTEFEAVLFINYGVANLAYHFWHVRCPTS